jgi:hypothetical protein
MIVWMEGAVVKTGDMTKKHSWGLRRGTQLASINSMAYM